MTSELHNGYCETHQSNGCITVRCCKEILDSQTIETLRTRIDELEIAFRHIHKASYADAPLKDYCAKCALDLRDPIHVRI